MTPPTPQETREPQLDNTERRARWLAFTVLCSIQLMIVLDVSIVTVALRTIQHGLGFSQANIAWVTNAYTIGFGGLLLLSGRLGDLFGRKKVFICGLIVFTVSSALCGASVSREMLVAMRFVQGAGAGMSYSVVMGIVFTLFADSRTLGRAMGAVGFVQAAGASIGIIAGGVVTQGISWHWIFYINVPIGAAAAVLTVRTVPADRGIGLGAGGADMLGAALVTGGLMLSVYVIATVGEYGWASGHTLGFGVASLLLLAAFAARQATAARPLIRLGIFRSRHLSGGNIVNLLLIAATVPSSILLALYMQQAAGYSPARTSLSLLPLALSAAGVSLGLSAPLTRRHGPRNVLVVSLMAIFAAMLLATRLPENPDYLADILPVVLLLGIGGGLGLPAVMTIAMSVKSPADAGLASGLAGTSGMIGDALGVATLIGIAAAHSKSLLGRGTPVAAALSGGFHFAFGIGAGIIGAAIAIGILMLRPLTQPPAQLSPEAGSRQSRPLWQRR